MDVQSFVVVAAQGSHLNRAHLARACIDPFLCIVGSDATANLKMSYYSSRPEEIKSVTSVDASL